MEKLEQLVQLNKTLLDHYERENNDLKNKVAELTEELESLKSDRALRREIPQSSDRERIKVELLKKLSTEL